MALGEPGLNHGGFHRRSANHGKFMEKFGRRDTSVVSKNNSSCHVQIDSIALFPDILEAIDRLRLPTVLQEAVTVVQFGSSNGQISVDNVVAILQRLKEKFGRTIGQEPEYQVFFQDLPTIDFNALIKLLNASILPNQDVHPVDCYAAAVAGSMYDRLFPVSTLHFGCAMFDLNCLSRIPESVSDRHSPAYNGGQTGLHRSSVATIKAYSAQAKEDLCNFLAARADEMADYGILCLNFRCRDSDSSTSYSTPHEVIGDCVWDDFIDKGIISADMRDSFNPLHYWRSVREITEVVADFSSDFEVHKEVVQQVHIPAGSASVASTPSPSLSSTAMLRAHFGKEVTNLYLQRYEQVLLEGIGNQTLSYHQSTTWMIVVLIRKPRG
ncbi:hypothetical protein R1flu_004547 [Riccia fluitans]|uniref:Uncharacterized protein n=1 Tax=Riccia fluitans TaxID=41844 RepID=A0ABD1YR88_9MARC